MRYLIHPFPILTLRKYCIEETIISHRRRYTAEIIRLSRVIAAADAYFDLTLVHTGQNYDYELNEIFFQEMEIRRPDVFLNAAGKTAAETIGTQSPNSITS